MARVQVVPAADEDIEDILWDLDQALAASQKK